MRFLLALAIFLPMLTWAADPAFVSASSLASSAESARTCAEPAGAAEGDIFIGFASMMDDAGVSAKDFGTPSGWTRLDSHFTTDFGDAAGTEDVRVVVDYIIRGGSAPALTWEYDGGSTTGSIRCTVLAFRPVLTSAPFDVTFAEGDHRVEQLNVANGTIWTGDGPPAVDVVTDGALVVVLQYRSNTGTLRVAPSGYTIVSDTATTNRAHLVAVKSITTAGTETPGAWGTTDLAGGTDALDYTLVLAPPAELPSGAPASIRRRM